MTADNVLWGLARLLTKPLNLVAFDNNQTTIANTLPIVFEPKRYVILRPSLDIIDLSLG